MAYKIIIDPGHGGNDPGKVGIDGSLEKNINLAISLYLKKELENTYALPSAFEIFRKIL